MKYGIYAIKDAKTSFMPIQVDMNDASAIRNFEHAVMRPDSLLSSHPNDYALYYLGQFDADTGVVIPALDPHQLCDAAQVLRKDG